MNKGLLIQNLKDCLVNFWSYPDIKKFSNKKYGKYTYCVFNSIREGMAIIYSSILCWLIFLVTKSYKISIIVALIFGCFYYFLWENSKYNQEFLNKSLNISS